MVGIFRKILWCACRLAVAALPLSALAADEGEACAPIYTPDDPRLFDFVKTRREVDFSTWQGDQIGQVKVMTLPIFNPADPHENNVLYRGLNRIHTATRPETVSKQLLFRSGDSLDADRVRESERILRGAGYLYDAMILPARVCDGRIDLLVVVRDIWTLQPTASFKRAGGQNSTSIGITDDNILGYGHGINLSWDKNAQRSGVVLSFNSKHLFDGHTVVEGAYARNDDGRRKDLTLERPFYAFDTGWAAGVTGYDDLRGIIESAGGVITNRYDARRRYVEAYAGLARPPKYGEVKRWRLGFTSDTEDYGNQDPAYGAALPVRRELAYPWLEYERRENVYVTTSNLSQLFRNEDVSLGEEWRFRFGATNSSLGSGTDALIARFAYDNTVGFGTHHLLRNRVSVDAYWDEQAQDWVDTLLSASTRYDFFINDNNRWHARLAVDAGSGLAVDKLLKGGGDALLRGYPSGWQAGDRRVVFNIERRHFYNTHVLHLFRLGSAAFVDVGKAWDSTGATVQSDRVLADVGIGLRVNSSKARPNHVLHLDLAVPLTDRGSVKGFQWSLQAQDSF